MRTGQFARIRNRNKWNSVRGGGGGKKNDQKLIFKKNQRRTLVRWVKPSNGSALKMKSVTFSRAFITRRAFTDSGQDEQIFAAKRIGGISANVIAAAAGAYSRNEKRTWRGRSNFFYPIYFLNRYAFRFL